MKSTNRTGMNGVYVVEAAGRVGALRCMSVLCELNEVPC